MIDCCACSFACFGPNDAYFFNGAGLWARNNLPPAIENLFVTNAMHEVYCMAIAPGGHSWLVAYRASSNGMPALLRQNLPPALDQWLVPDGLKVARDVSSLEVSLGAHGGFFAQDGSGYKWDNLPPMLQAYIESGQNPDGTFIEGSEPRNVSLGFDGSWVMLTADGRGKWDLRLAGQPGHQCLEDWLHAESLTGLSHHDVILDPHRPGSHLAVSLNGEVGRNLPDSFLNACDQMAYTLPNWEEQLKREKNRASGNEKFHGAKNVLEVSNGVLELVNAAMGNGNF